MFVKPDWLEIQCDYLFFAQTNVRKCVLAVPEITLYDKKKMAKAVKKEAKAASSKIKRAYCKLLIMFTNIILGQKNMIAI